MLVKEFLGQAAELPQPLNVFWLCFGNLAKFCFAEQEIVRDTEFYCQTVSPASKRWNRQVVQFQRWRDLWLCL